MTRRDALKAGLGGLFATFLNWPTTNRIDMLQFCGDSYRYDIAKPFEQLGWAYATDMKSCIRTTQLEDATEAGEMRFPKAAALKWDGKHWDDNGFITLPKLSPVAWESGPCYECMHEQECPCEESGEPGIGCDKCNWQGFTRITCANCKDDKPLSASLVHGHKMDIVTHKKLLTLPDAEVKLVNGLFAIKPERDWHHAPEYLVRFNGGQAVVLGIAQRRNER